VEKQHPFQIETVRMYVPRENTRIYKTLKKALLLKDKDVKFIIFVSFNSPLSEEGGLS